MKKKGSVCSFKDEKERALWRAYKAVLGRLHFFDVEEDFVEVVNMPCSRYWVSEDRCYNVISKMLCGEDVLFYMHASKREMFEDIYNKVKKEMDENDISLRDAVFNVVNGGAPKFFMSEKYARRIIYRLKRDALAKS